MAPEFGKPIHQLPLIPADILKKHHVHESLDSRFRSAARLLQALWREDRSLAIGSYVSEDGKRRKLGSRISESAGRTGGNFLTPEIAHTARREAAYREIGGLPILNAKVELALQNRSLVRHDEGIFVASVNSPARRGVPANPARVAYAGLPLNAMPCK